MEVLDVIGLLRVVAGDVAANLNMGCDSVREGKDRYGRWAYDEVRFLCRELQSGFERLAADVVPVTASTTVSVPKPKLADNIETHILIGPSSFKILRMSVVL